MAEVRLNEILITTKTPGIFFALRAPLYDIESTNTTESRIQSISTSEGNEHTVQKLSNESTVSTKVPSGIFELINNPTQTKQALGMLIIGLKA